MPRALNISAQIPAAAMLLALATSSYLQAQSVWSGFDFSFTRPNDVDPTLPENQDRITGNVWITRNVQAGIYNIAAEEFYDPASPADTEWATDLNNPGDTIDATNWANLDFDPWIDAYGGMGSMALPAILISRNAVLHLITDNIYLDIQFNAWTSGGLGGGFSYDRAEAPPGLPPTGDYNQDSIVDTADYVLWRDTYGQAAVPPGSGADGDLSGVIDDPDYTFWAARYGQPIPPAASGSIPLSVPEPPAVALLSAGLALLALRSPIAPYRPTRAWRFKRTL